MSKVSHLSSRHNLRFWLSHDTHGLLGLPDESSSFSVFGGMLNKKLPNRELPTGRLTPPPPHSGFKCKWRLRHAPCSCPTERPPDLPLQMPGFGCNGCNHAEKQTRQRGICSNSRFLPQRRVGSVGLHSSKTDEAGHGQNKQLENTGM